MGNEFSWLARLLQISDSTFPTGGYAHSNGFEQVVQFGLVRDEITMLKHLENHLWPMLVHFELPVVRFAQEAANADDNAGLVELDAMVDATKTPRELREASRATGARRLHALLAADASPSLKNFARAVEEGRAHAHHAVVFGAGLCAMPTKALLASWAFQSLSATCQSAPKLLRMGQDAAQRMLTASLVIMDANVARSQKISRDDLGWFDPLADLASMHHEIAHERLYIS